MAVLLATSLADWTKCRFATGFVVFDDAMRHVLHSADVCLAITVVLVLRRFRRHIPRLRANEDQEEIIDRNEDDNPVEL